MADCSNHCRSCQTLTDSFGRTVNYLRVSVTDRCNFRCTYCMAEGTSFLPKKELLTLEELTRICAVFIERGIDKIRITGGEPLVRRDIMSFFRQMSVYLETKHLQELTLTTNGSLLTKFAGDLSDCGVRRINVSLDTLNPDLFKVIARRGDFHQVMAGIKAAQAVGMKIKINAVALRGINENELADMVVWAHDQDMDITLIEAMPLGEIDDNRLDHYLPLDIVRQKLEQRFTLAAINYQTAGPARYVKVRETGGRLGFITPLSHNFCHNCNRVRLTCTGSLYLCLGQEDKVELMPAVRGQRDNDLLHHLLDRAMAIKPKGHDFNNAYRHNVPAQARTMNHTGG